MEPAALPAPAAPSASGLTSSIAAPPPSLARTGGSSVMPVLAGLVLVALAVVAFLASRRRRRVSRLVEIVESSSLGPKRSLVVARMGDELLLLGSSEGGIALLATRPMPAAAAGEPAPSRAAEPRPRAANDSSRFELVLGETAEDVELRRKLAAGHAGSIR